MDWQTFRPFAYAAVGAWAVCGCSVGGASKTPQSHFAFPNSNVIPLSPSEGSVSKLCGILGITWGAPDGDDQELAVKQALDAANGDLLINLRTDTKVLIIPPLFSLCTTNVRGTAARMEIGRQELGAVNAAAPPPPAPPPSQVEAPMPAAPRGGCMSDSECKGGRSCIAGQCTAAQPAQFPPPAPPSAPRGGCMSNAECKGGRVCVAGQCTASPAMPTSCLNDRDCAGDAICDRGRCSR